MENVDRGAYGTVKDALAAFTASADPQRITAVADEVLAVADLLQREPRLRRALADSARPAEGRAELLESLVTGKVSGDAVGLLKTVVSGRWSSPGALLSGVEALGVDAVYAAADKAGELSDVEDELFRFGQVVSGDNRLAVALGDSTAPVALRVQLVEDLLEGKAKPATVRLAKLAPAGFGGRGFAGSLTRLVELAAAKRDSTVAYVTTATPLTEAEEQRMAARLAEMYGRSVSLKIDVDPRVLGGVRVKVGSDLYDGTVARRLAEARTALTK